MSNILTNNINPRSGNKITIGGVNDKVSIAGTLTYEDVSSVDSVGLITARSGIHVTGTGSSVGIGTDSPEKKLHITSGSNAYDSVQIGAAGTDGLLIGNDPNNSNAAIFHQGASANLEIGSQQFITINTGNTAGIASERIRVSSQGRVGIGQSSPITLLHVEGTESGSGEGLVRFRNNHTTSGQPSWGLGITRQNNAVRALLLGSDDNKNAAICVNGNNSLIFGEEVSGTWTEHMRIDSSGNVGIGLTNPGDYLSSAHQLVISDSASTGLTIATPNSSSGTIAFADGTGAADNARGLVRYGHSDNNLQFHTNAGERLRIDSIGGTLYYGNASSVGGVTATTRAALDADGTLDLEIPGTSLVGHLYVISALTTNASARTARSYRIALRLNNSALITQEFSQNGSNSGRSFTISEVSGGGFPNTLRFTDTSSTACTVSMHFVGAAGL